MSDESKNTDLLDTLQKALRKPVEKYFAQAYDELTRHSLWIHTREGEPIIGLTPLEPDDAFGRFGMADAKMIRRPLYDTLVEARENIDHAEPDQLRALVLLNELLRVFDEWRLRTDGV